MMKILQWNCRSFNKRIPELLYLLNEFGVDIAVLCETRLDEKYKPSINNYDIYSVDRNKRGGGVTILVSNKFRYTPIFDVALADICKKNEIEIIIGKVWLGPSEHLYVCSLYVLPEEVIICIRIMRHGAIFFNFVLDSIL